MSEKIYRVQMNSKGMPNFSTAVEVPSGEWIDTSSGEHYKCSICGCRALYYLYDRNKGFEWLSDFCPDCGARMVTDDETD